MKVDYVRFGYLVRRHRGIASLREIEELTGVSKATLCRIEKGKAQNIGLDKFVCICEWANISPADIFSTEQTPAPSSEIVFNGVSIRIEVRPV